MDMDDFAFILLPLALCVVGLGIIAWARLWPVHEKRLATKYSKTENDDAAMVRRDVEAIIEPVSLFASGHQARTHMRNVLKSAELTAQGEYPLPNPLPEELRESRRLFFVKAFNKSIGERAQRRSLWVKGAAKKQGTGRESISGR
ncbi:hypothetical protein [Rhodospirillum sp. A1_3_36]|uniref:hypothetical protein n=1 Tax=Rhodospirillum sp. A1_3_36 TaxID=3391666 RepID=UPI0039A6BC60